ncbi:MAG: hypothetical protein AMS26_11960 [Bacteroides sp. SM23_62]|nr:MAG: hypothetical protein AMS26_11960 [Bacteroides sp. SM23_62]
MPVLGRKNTPAGKQGDNILSLFISCGFWCRPTGEAHHPFAPAYSYRERIPWRILFILCDNDIDGIHWVSYHTHIGVSYLAAVSPVYRQQAPCSSNDSISVGVGTHCTITVIESYFVAYISVYYSTNTKAVV